MPDTFAAAFARLWPHADARIPHLRDGILDAAPSVFASRRITSPVVVAHIMAQISHECGAGRDVVENLNYTAGRMMQVWPSRFPTMASAAPYAGRPQALANKVYNGRMGNCEGSDDGWTFRGRGAAQTTGRDGYARLARATGLDLVAQPELVNDPRCFLACGVADFIACGCLPYAERDDVVGVTRRLNGGTIGLAERKAWLARWKAALGNAPLAWTVTAPPLVPAADGAGPLPLSPAPAAAPSGVARLVAALVAAFRRA